MRDTIGGAPPRPRPAGAGTLRAVRAPNRSPPDPHLAACGVHRGARLAGRDRPTRVRRRRPLGRRAGARADRRPPGPGRRADRAGARRRRAGRPRRRPDRRRLRARAHPRLPVGGLVHPRPAGGVGLPDRPAEPRPGRRRDRPRAPRLPGARGGGRQHPRGGGGPGGGALGADPQCRALPDVALRGPGARLPRRPSGQPVRQLHAQLRGRHRHADRLDLRPRARRVHRAQPPGVVAPAGALNHSG